MTTQWVLCEKKGKQEGQPSYDAWRESVSPSHTGGNDQVKKALSYQMCKLHQGKQNGPFHTRKDTRGKAELS